jgi:hypothetical protein
MPSIVEATGAAFYNFFVPARVIESQAENQKMLEEKAERLNNDVAQTLATAKQSGVLSDGQAKQTLQSMNRSVYMGDQIMYDLGEQVYADILSSAADAPGTLINYANEKVVTPAAKTVGKTVQNLVPWQLWLIVGIALAVGVGIFALVKAKT